MTINNYNDCIHPIHTMTSDEQREIRENDLSYGEMLKQKVEERGWTKEEFAKKLGQSKGTVVNYYYSFSVPTRKTREIIEMLLGISITVQEEYILKTRWKYYVVYRQSDGTLKVTSTQERKKQQIEYLRMKRSQIKKTPKLLPLAKKIQKEVQEERSGGSLTLPSRAHPLTALLTQAEKGTVFLYHNNDLYSLSKV